jgi:hypothetical protein
LRTAPDADNLLVGLYRRIDEVDIRNAGRFEAGVERAVDQATGKPMRSVLLRRGFMEAAVGRAIVKHFVLAAAEDGVVALQFHELRRSVELLGQDEPPDIAKIGNQVTWIAERYRTEDARGQHHRRRGTNGVANRAQNRFVHVRSPWFAIG